MPALPPVTLKLRNFRRRFGISAPRMVIRSHLPWQWLLLIVVASFFALGLAVWLVFRVGLAENFGDGMESLKQELAMQREELNLLRASTGTRQNVVSMERATQQQLLARIDSLERENGALKEDIRLFERLIPVTGDEAIVRVENFRVMQDVGGRYRYRLLVAFQPARQVPEFRGQLQLAVSFILAGKEQTMFFPKDRESATPYQLELKHFLRREGVFELPSNAQLKAVEARILQGNTLKFKQLAQL
jgi:low affinity Fe/Cu permease